MIKTYKYVMAAVGVLSLVACQATPNVAKPDDKARTSVQAQSSVLIIYFEKDKKPLLMNAIAKRSDKMAYDYKSLHAVAITTQDAIDDAINFYQQIEGVLQVNPNEIMQLHTE